MIDFKNFKIKRGPSKDLHDPRLIVEEGYWYLSTDKAELFIGIIENGTPVLKPINGELIPEVNLEGYATEDFVREAIASIEIPEVELYDDSELRNLINSKADSAHSHEEYALAEHTHDEYLTEHQDISHLATKEELPNLDSYAKLENIPDVSKFITEIPAVYVTETELENKGYLTEHQSLAGYATESYVLAEIAKAALEGNDIDLSAYATKEFVAEEINKIEVPEAYDDAELRSLINGKAESDHTHEEYSLVDHKHAEYLTEHQDLSHLALKEHKHDEYLTEHQSLEGYAKTTELFSKDYNDLTNKPEIPSIEGLASETYVQTEIGKIKFPETDLSNYYTKEEVNNLLPVEEIEEVKTKVETVLLPKVEEEIEPTVGELKTWVENKEYLQDIDLDGYATEEYVDNAIANIEHPANPTKVSELENDANYTNETKVLELIENNASSKIGISFTTDITVGHLAAGTQISKDMTIGQILYNMLFSSSQPEEPENPEVPETSEEIINSIVENKTPMYSVDSTGEVTELSYDNIIVYNETESNVMPTESGFYQVVDDSGEVIESGYQEITANNPDVPYIIALPLNLDFNNMVSVQTYDTLEGVWKDEQINMSNDYESISNLCAELGVDISHIDLSKYTLWADLAYGPSGKIHRFIINNN